jgi:hypothetical protein
MYAESEKVSVMHLQYVLTLTIWGPYIISALSDGNTDIR